MIKAAVVMIKRENTVLIGRRGMYRDDGTLRVNGGLWEFMGGKFEAGETPEEAAIREVMEETNLTIKNLKLKERKPITWPDMTYDVFTFTAEYHDGELIASEHDTLIWCEINRLQEYSLLDFETKDVMGLLNG